MPKKERGDAAAILQEVRVMKVKMVPKCR